MNGGKLVIGTELDTKSFDAQIEITKRKLEMLEKSADESKIPEQFRRSKDEALALNKEIEQTRNQLINLQNQQNKLDKSDSMNFKGALNGLKKFGLGLIGIRGIYSMVRKASSAWLSQDTELAKKFQNIWVALGSVLAPVLEWVANLMYKLLGYVNEFVKAFTGGKVDLIANANAKAIKNQANAMKELKNQTYGFDELNIQQVNEQGGGSSAGGAISPIELDPKLAKQIGTIGSTLGNIWDKLKPIRDFINKYLGDGGILSVGLAVLIGVKASAAGAGGKALLGVLSILILIYETMQLINALKGIDDMKKSWEDNTNALDKHNKQMDEVLGNYEDLAKQGKITADKTDVWEKSLRNFNESIKEQSNNIKENGWSVAQTTKEQTKLYEKTQIIIDSYEEMGKTIGLSKNASNDYVKALESQRTVIKNLGGDTTEIDKKIADFKKQLKETNFTKSNPTIKLTITAEDKAKGVIDKVTKQLNDFSKKFGINLATKSIKKGMNPLELAFNGLGEFLKFGSNFMATGGVLNKSALGSIVNNPGKGVYLGNRTIGGEAGKEGVIPLTDPNAMTELGETIGRYITVNLTNITKLDSKTINKENKKIGNDMEFIRNGGGA